MSKASIKASIRSVNASLKTVNGDISDLKAAKQAVNAVKTTLDYKVTGSYHLEGDKYDSLEQDEKDILSNLKRDMITKKENVIEQLDAAISSKETTAFSLSQTLSTLTAQLAAMK